MSIHHSVYCQQKAEAAYITVFDSLHTILEVRNCQITVVGAPVN